MKISPSIRLFRALAGNRQINIQRGRGQVIATITGSNVVMIIDRAARTVSIA